MSSACAAHLIKHRQQQIAHFGLTTSENQMYWSAQTHHFLLTLKLIQRCRIKVQDRSVSLTQDCTWENTDFRAAPDRMQETEQVPANPTHVSGLVGSRRGSCCSHCSCAQRGREFPLSRAEPECCSGLALRHRLLGQDWDPWQPLCREVVFRVGVNFSGLSPCLLLWVCVGLQSP